MSADRPARDHALRGRRLESLLAAVHEFGHGLYEHQVAPELARTNLGHGTSMSMHESQSKLWENHVARNRGVRRVMADELAAAGVSVEPDALHALVVRVRPSLIRVEADQLTYPLHIVLRFELELELIEGTLDVADLPAAWNAGMRRLLGVEVPDDAHGVLQDVHWAAGAFGYFPSYALGCLIAAQLWERLEADLGPQDDALRRVEVGPIKRLAGRAASIATAGGWTPSPSSPRRPGAGSTSSPSCATPARRRNSDSASECPRRGTCAARGLTTT